MENNMEDPQKIKVELHVAQQFYFWDYIERKQKH